MGLFDLLKNFDPDAIVKGINDLEQAIGKALDGVDGAAEKVENTAKAVEEKLTQPKSDSHDVVATTPKADD